MSDNIWQTKFFLKDQMLRIIALAKADSQKKIKLIFGKPLSKNFSNPWQRVSFGKSATYIETQFINFCKCQLWAFKFTD